MSSDELDAFRAELLRQRVIFEAELRRQSEHFEARLQAVSRELADREADCRNLQSVVTILGKKVDSFSEQRPPTRHQSISRAAPSERSDETKRTRVGSASRRPSPLVSSAPTAVPLNRLSSLKPLSRTSSPRPNLPSPIGHQSSHTHLRSETPR